MTGSQAMPINRLPAAGDAAVCMGVFDGVHRGHLALVERTVRAARERGLRSVALVFDPHPDEVVRPGTVVPRLAPLGENLRRLSAAGIDVPMGVRFDAELRARTPEEFLAAMAPAVRVRALIMTPESAFGRNRAGTPDAMSSHGRAAGFDVVLAEDIVQEEGAPISSGRVREALREGDVVAATRLLGHAPYLEAPVGPASAGQRPLVLAYCAALPPDGRYHAAIRRPDSDGAPSDGVLVIGDGDIGLEGWEGGSADGDVLAIDLLERIG